MKKIIYLFASLFVVLSIHSCKRLGDNDGNLLNDMDANQGGLTGARFLYQEVNSADTLAEYHYSGLKLTDMKGDRENTQLIYSGDLINKITYNGVVDGDSIVYSQLFTYDPTGTKISTIAETRTVYLDVDAPPTTPPTPLVVENYKTLYTVNYNTANKISEVTAITGQVIPLTTFAYTSYEKTTYTYDAKNNVSKAVLDFGGVVGTVLQPAQMQVAYGFSNFDQMKNPYSNLLPYQYILSKTFEDPIKNYWFSVNNPQTVTITTEMVPLPVIYNTQYTYDPQGYPLSGWGKNYDYRPF